MWWMTPKKQCLLQTAGLVHTQTHRSEMQKPEAHHIPTAGKIIRGPGDTLNWCQDLGWMQVIGQKGSVNIHKAIGGYQIVVSVQ